MTAAELEAIWNEVVEQEPHEWVPVLDPLEASAAPAEMTVADGKGAKVALKNVLVGEVWLCSGQSNMQWIASKCNVGRVLQKQIAERVAEGKEKPPVIREGKVTNVFSALHPIEHAEGEWSTQAGDFSAIAYAFAYELHRETLLSEFQEFYDAIDVFSDEVKARAFHWDKGKDQKWLERLVDYDYRIISGLGNLNTGLRALHKEFLSSREVLPLGPEMCPPTTSMIPSRRTLDKCELLRLEDMRNGRPKTTVPGKSCNYS